MFRFFVTQTKYALDLYVSLTLLYSIYYPFCVWNNKSDSMACHRIEAHRITHPLFTIWPMLATSVSAVKSATPLTLPSSSFPKISLYLYARRVGGTEKVPKSEMIDSTPLIIEGVMCEVGSIHFWLQVLQKVRQSEGEEEEEENF